MYLRNIKPKLLAAAILAILSGSALASVEYTGTPDAQVPLLKKYGVDVPTKSGLKSILPQGWTLLIHKSATLPPVMAWDVDEPWNHVLDRLADKEQLTVRLNWTNKTVTILASAAPAEPAKVVATEAVPQATPVLAAPKMASPATAPLEKAPGLKSAPVTVAQASLLPPGAEALAVNSVAQSPVLTSPSVAAQPVYAVKTAVAGATTVASSPIVSAPASPNVASVPAEQAPVALSLNLAPAAVKVAAGSGDSVVSHEVARIPVSSALPATSAASMAKPLVTFAGRSAATVVPAMRAEPMASVAQSPVTQRALDVAPVKAEVVPVPPATFPQNSATAQVGGSAKVLVEQLAQKFGYVLSWEAPDAQIPGAVTLLGVDIAEDVKLLQGAIGPSQTPIAIEVYRGSSVLRVIPRNRSSQVVAVMDVPFNGIISAPQHATSSIAATAPVRVVATPSAVRVQEMAPSVAPAPVQVVRAPSIAQAAPLASAVSSDEFPEPSVTLTVLKGDSLTNVLKTFFMKQGWDLQWRAASDLQAAYPVTIEAGDVKKVMGKLLPKLGLVADFYNPSKLVVIRTADASTN